MSTKPQEKTTESDELQPVTTKLRPSDMLRLDEAASRRRYDRNRAAYCRDAILEKLAADGIPDNADSDPADCTERGGR